MASTLIVPIILVTGDLQFAEVKHDATIQDVLDVLLAIPGVKKDILGDLHARQDGQIQWALQKLRSEQKGRRWEEEELEGLGDGE